MKTSFRFKFSCYGVAALVLLLVFPALLQAQSMEEMMSASYEQAGKSMDQCTAELYKDFEKTIHDNPGNSKKDYNRVRFCKEASDEAVDFIESLKKLFAANVKPGDKSAIADYLINNEQGKTLKKKLEKYKASVQSISDSMEESNKVIFSNQLFKALETDNKTWVNNYFKKADLTKATLVLNFLETDIKTGELNYARYKYSRLKADYNNYDMLVPMVNCKKPIVFQGESYEAEIFLGAYNSKLNPEIIANDTRLEVRDGVADYKFVASGEGAKTYEGDILTHETDGTIKKYHFKSAYQVFVGSAVITADKMNVLYTGLDNPVSVSVPGYPPDKIKTAVTGLQSWTGSNGRYIAKPVDIISEKQATVSVSVKTNDNQVKMMGVKSFRIKHVPKPKILLGTMDGGLISKVQLSVQKVVFAQQENFVMEGLKYTVKKFKITIVHQDKSMPVFSQVVNDQILPADWSEQVAASKPGDMFIISDIVAEGPTGDIKFSSGPVFTLE